MRASRRTAVAVAGVAVTAMVLAGCGDGGDSGGGDDKKSDAAPSEKTPSPAPSQPDPTQAPREATGDAKKAQGTWMDKAAMTGKAELLGLIVTKNKVITMGSSKDSSCVGTLSGDTFPLSFALKCQGPGGDWNKGKLTAVQAKQLTVTWNSGKKQTLMKSAKPEKMPTALPTQ